MHDQSTTLEQHSSLSLPLPHLYGSLRGIMLLKAVPLLLPLLPLLFVAQRSTTAEAQATPSLAASGVMMGHG